MTDMLPPPAVPAGAAAAAAARFAATAAAGRESDVSYATLDSPVGRLVAVRTRQGLAMLSYEDHHGGLDQVLDKVAAVLSPRVLEAPARLDDVRRQLEEYFAGRRTDFELPLDWTLTTPFTQRILQATCAVPFGTTATYGAMAAAAGNARASRAAGRALGSNPIPIVVPCHRIVGTSGRLTGYTGGLHRKVALLRLEGLIFD
ncbi:MAG: methylated-DNA--[protein]-cysteine S-methyltransferase [Solirubrobacterales bacterium]|jgi:methylated-DNA-[protein]-cysteine S-methyltransferase|nr:methylated-DNA--[protein]-cysteine S-methyltransferase [Solirubrobacterales bacterium]